MIHAWVDGSVSGGKWGAKTGPKKPTRNDIGWLVRKDTGEWIAHHSFCMGENEAYSGNSAEEFAVSSALRWLLRNGYQNESIIIHSDSQLTCNHISGTFTVHNETLARYVKANRALMAHFPSVKMKWIRREENKYADAMSKIYQPKFFHIFGGKIPETELTAEFLAKWR